VDVKWYGRSLSEPSAYARNAVARPKLHIDVIGLVLRRSQEMTKRRRDGGSRQMQSPRFRIQNRKARHSSDATKGVYVIHCVLPIHNSPLQLLRSTTAICYSSWC
jgi:hypothetical protein